MFHKLFNEELSNRSIGIITKLIDENHIEVAFSINSGINQIIVEKITTYFNFNGASAYRTQFPLQNAFPLTVHKMQGLTLPYATVSLEICSFDQDAIKVDNTMLLELNRLQQKFNSRYILY